MQQLRCSAPTARAILETLDKLGVGDFQNPGPPMSGVLTLAEPLQWLLEPLKELRHREGEPIETKLTPSEVTGPSEPSSSGAGSWSDPSRDEYPCPTCGTTRRTTNPDEPCACCLEGGR
jgi:hypothetical protein